MWARRTHYQTSSAKDSLTATTDLINFIIVTCKIWRKIGLGHETSMAETETLTIFVETRPRRDIDASWDRLETETSRPRPQPCLWASKTYEHDTTVCSLQLCSVQWLLITWAGFRVLWCHCDHSHHRCPFTTCLQSLFQVTGPLQWHPLANTRLRFPQWFDPRGPQY